MDVDIGLSVQEVALVRRREGSDKAWIVWFERTVEALMRWAIRPRGSSSPTAIRIVVALMPASWRAVSESLGMAGQRGAEHDRAGLTQTDLQSERRLQAIEQLLEVVSSDPEWILRLGFEVDREKRRRQTEKQMLFAHRGVGIPRNAGAVDIDARMPAEHIGENQGVDGFGEKAKRQRSHAIMTSNALSASRKAPFT
jgi:hypothetical protein